MRSDELDHKKLQANRERVREDHRQRWREDLEHDPLAAWALLMFGGADGFWDAVRIISQRLDGRPMRYVKWRAHVYRIRDRLEEQGRTLPSAILDNMGLTAAKAFGGVAFDEPAAQDAAMNLADVFRDAFAEVFLEDLYGPKWRSHPQRELVVQPGDLKKAAGVTSARETEAAAAFTEYQGMIRQEAETLAPTRRDTLEKLIAYQGDHAAAARSAGVSDQTWKKRVYDLRHTPEMRRVWRMLVLADDEDISL